MQNNTMNEVIEVKNIIPSKKKEKKIKFFERCTLGNIFKIIYLFIITLSGNGIFALILYFLVNIKYNTFLAICVLISGFFRFLYEVYKILFAQELLAKKLIQRRIVKLTLIETNKYDDINKYLTIIKNK